jgi:hypothetical protein
LKHSNTISLFATLAGRYLDIATTYLAIHLAGAQEANPLMRAWLHNPPALLAIQTLGGTVLWAILFSAGKVAGGWIRRALLWLAVILSWLPIFNNLMIQLGYSPLAALYMRS